MADVTQILSAIEQGDPHAAEQLLPLVYDELRKLAAARLAEEKPGQTLQADRPGPRGLPAAGGRRDSRSTGTAAATSSPPPPRPCAASSSTMPAASRARNAAAIASAWTSTSSPPPRPNVPTTCWPSTRPSTRLAAADPQAAELVKLRYFAGLTHRRGRGRPRHLPRDRRPLLGLRPRLAAPLAWAVPTPDA